MTTLTPTKYTDEAVSPVRRPMDRFHYRREHEHPMGWSVWDAKKDCAVAYGDKNICAGVAEFLNGRDGSAVLEFAAAFA